MNIQNVMAICLFVTITCQKEPQKLLIERSTRYPEFQESKWIDTTLDSKDFSGKTEFEQILNRWKGERYNFDLLYKHQVAYNKSPGFNTAFNQAIAVLGFSGVFEGHSSTYWRFGQLADYLGQREYRLLAKHWPKGSSVSPYHFRVRALLYQLITGRVDYNYKAMTKAAKYFKDDECTQRLYLNAKFRYNDIFEPHATKADLQSDIALIRKMVQSSPKAGNFNVYYKYVSYYAKRFDDKELYALSLKLAMQLKELYRNTKIDAEIIPALDEAISWMKKNKKVAQ